MDELQNIHPHIYKNFQNGLSCARRSDRFWAGLYTFRMIEQVLMRSVKTSDELIGGKGVRDAAACLVDVNDAMQTVTGVRYSHVLQQCHICTCVSIIRKKSE